MSDQLENFIRNNRDKLDQQNPSPELWNSIESGLGQGAGAGASTGTAASTKTGFAAKFAQLSTGVKVAVGVAASAVVATAIYVATTVGSGSSDPSGPSAQIASQNDPGQTPPTEQVISEVRQVIAPIPAADIQFDGYEIDAKKGGTIETASGTIITIPKGAFVDADGKPVKGTVQIEYREFHDAFDALLSGIPMDYDNNGKKEDFQTAGMMEIQGSQAGAPVFIAEGKSLQVSLGSFAPLDYDGKEDSYNLYYFDKEAGAWEDIGKPEASQNVERDEKIALLKAEKRRAKKPRRPSKSSIDNADDAIAIEFDVKEFPELKPFRNVRWEAIDKQYLEDNQWALTRRWSDVKLEKMETENEYNIVFRNKKQKFELKVVPMLNGKDYDKAMAQFDKKMARYKKLSAQREEELKRLANQASVSRSFSVSGFGIYNCDRFYMAPNIVSIPTEINFSEEVYMDPEKTMLFHITGENRALLSKTYAQVEKSLAFSPTSDNYLVAVLPDKRIAAMKPEDFKPLVKKDQSSQKVPIKLQTIEHKVESALDLRIALGI